jgi:hypothetical protein
MTRAERIAELECVGFQRLPSVGTNYTGFQLGSCNVDVGPRGGVSCWFVTTINGTVVTKRAIYLDAINFGLFYTWLSIEV